MNIKEIIDRISSTHMAEKKDIIAIIENNSNDEYLFESADNIRKQIYGKDVYIRGLIELSNYCKNNCYYCGIQGSNPNANRYRLSKEEILLPVRMVTSLDIEALFFKAVRILIIQMKLWFLSCRDQKALP